MKNKEDLLKVANCIYGESLMASSYFRLLEQYYEYMKEKKEIFDFSPAFWMISKRAIAYSCLIEISKVYDDTKNVININLLLNDEAGDIISSLKLAKIVSSKTICDILKIDKAAISVKNYYDLLPSEIHELCRKAKKDINKPITVLRNLRNKSFAHNDFKLLLTDDKAFNEKHKLEWNAMSALIDYALSVSRIIIYMLTGKFKAVAYQNIDDMYGVMQLLTYGMEEQKRRDQAVLNHDLSFLDDKKH